MDAKIGSKVSLQDSTKLEEYVLQLIRVGRIYTISRFSNRFPGKVYFEELSNIIPPQPLEAFQTQD